MAGGFSRWARRALTRRRASSKNDAPKIGRDGACGTPVVAVAIGALGSWPAGVAGIWLPAVVVAVPPVVVSPVVCPVVWPVVAVVAPVVAPVVCPVVCPVVAVPADVPVVVPVAGPVVVPEPVPLVPVVPVPVDPVVWALVPVVWEGEPLTIGEEAKMRAERKRGRHQVRRKS